MGKKFSFKKPQDTTFVTAFEPIQTRKLLNASGAPGSLVETRKGCLLVKPFGEWPYFKRYPRARRPPVEDPRLVERLRNTYPNVTELVALPVNEVKKGYPQIQNATVAAEYFPKWMFSPLTRRFDHLDNWLTKWRDTVAETDREKVHPPKCYLSYQSAKEKKGRKKFYELEQVRFILISPSGAIADVPWDRWVFGHSKHDASDDAPPAAADSPGENIDGEEATKGKIRLDFDREIPQDVYYEYQTSARFGDLRGISIVAKRGEKEVARRTLAGIFNLEVPEWAVLGIKGGPDKMKVVIRSSNSVYYPNVIQSLFLPDLEDSLKKAQTTVTEVKRLHESGRSPERIAEFLEDLGKDIEKLSSGKIAELIANNFQSGVKPGEAAYRQSEFDFVVGKTELFHHEPSRTKIRPVELGCFGNISGLAKVYAFDTLKVTSVQPSFTRLESVGREAILADDGTGSRGIIIRKKNTSGWRRESVRRFPALESYGEGLFFVLDETLLKNWEQRPDVVERVANIQRNYEQSRGASEQRVITPRFVLVHTLSHLLIRELEFLCGYPATSLQERLYVDPDRAGVLIYTVAGSEGSYGGLVSLSRSAQLGKLIESALRRADDCPSDPLCYHTDPTQGQGVGGTNLAACHSCALLPETSCEEFNKFLDRQVVIDKTLGFFM